MSYAELHFHLLPGVDDGPKTLADSVELAAAAAAEGTRTIVATPHVNASLGHDVDALPARVAEVQRELRRHRIPIDVRCGAELALERVAGLSDRELEIIAQGPPQRRWLLLEAPLDGLTPSYTTAADELRARGFAVVVAHPERALQHRDAGWKAVEHEIAAGSAMQVNAWSVAGLYGDRVQRDAIRVLRAPAVVAIASDAHGPARMPALALALDALTRLGDHEAARRVDAIPHALLSEGLPARARLAA